MTFRPSKLYLSEEGVVDEGIFIVLLLILLLLFVCFDINIDAVVNYWGGSVGEIMI